MPIFSLTINSKPQTLEVDEGTPLLWALRDTLGMTGTKYGCGAGLCGSCTVHVDGEATRSCVTPVDSVVGKSIVTIEGLSANRNHPVQLAWLEEEVPQCGYCQPGQIMTAAALLAQKSHPTDEDIDAAFAMNICRCGMYNRIRSAIHLAASKQLQIKGGQR